MKIGDLLQELGEVIGIIGNLDLSIDLGYTKKEKTCRDGRGDLFRVIHIYPHVEYTDGTTRPAWETVWCSISVKM